MNNFSIVGRISQQPELKYSSGGMAYAKLDIACKCDFKGTTSFFKVAVFGKTAENSVKFLDKGRVVYVSGEFTVNKYTDKNGNNRSEVEFNARNIEFLGGTNNNNNNEEEQPTDTETEAKNLDTEFKSKFEDEEDIPF